MSAFYQINCSVGSSGKRVSVTKRRVRWRWGMASEDAFATGSTGMQSRFHEHEVALTWSLTSGKRLVLLDGKEVHYSTGRRTEGKFQYSWTVSELGNHVFTIIAFAVTPMRSAPASKQFDLLINGQSYSDFHNINELGVQEDHTINRKLNIPANMECNTITCPPTREQEWQWAQQVIELEQKREMNEVEPVPRTPPSSLCAGKNREMNRLASPSTKRVSFSCDIVSVDLLSAALPVQTGLCATTSEDEFNPNKPQSYETIWSSIMDAYDSGGTNGTNQVDSLAVETEVRRTTETTLNHINPAPVYPTPIHQAQTENTHHEYGSTRGHTNGIHHDSGVLHVQTENIDYDSENVQAQLKNVHNKNGVVSPHGVNGIDGAMQNLVNLDDILSPVFSTTLTMNPSVKREKMANRSINSRGLSPKMGSSGQIGHPLTLLELKDMQGNENVNPAREVMKVHTHYAAEQNPVALVIYNQQQQYNNYSHMCR
mmetsp:Transcript_26670/g.31459  ORF Transcript_26670/g.31459 Transcript_26670/m.31459 type:complete len:484 (-) Transcript_26670:404-1855(-)